MRSFYYSFEPSSHSQSISQRPNNIPLGILTIYDDHGIVQYVIYSMLMVAEEEKFRQQVATLLKNQHQLREEFLLTLSSAVAQELQKAECLFYPESHAVQHKGFKKLREMWSQKPQNHTEFEVGTVWGKELAWPEEVLAEKDQLGEKFDEVEGFFYPLYPGSLPPLHDRCNPVYKVKFKSLRKNFEELWKLCNEQFYFFSNDFLKGFCVSHSVGYLPKNLNPSERIYEVTAWE